MVNYRCTTTTFFFTRLRIYDFIQVFVYQVIVNSMLWYVSDHFIIAMDLDINTVVDYN